VSGYSYPDKFWALCCHSGPDFGAEGGIWFYGARFLLQHQSQDRNDSTLREKLFWIGILLRQAQGTACGENAQKISFAPYGSRTIEVVAQNLIRMQQGEFPPPSAMESSFRYEAIASFKRRFTTQKYRIQISDYAGEHLKEFDNADEMWLHRTNYFEYVVSADALLFMLDCEMLLNRDFSSGDPIPYLENIFVATVHTFIEKRRGDPTKLSDVPVALLFSKSDLLSSEEDIEKVTSRVSRLLSVCQKRFRYFRYFFVSSVGAVPELNDEGHPIPPSNIEPIGVVEPLIWLLGK